MVRAGANKEYFSDAVSFHDQVHGQLITTSNKYGKGESPDSTLGLQDIRKFLMPVFCPCTVDVSHMGLAVADDGSVTKLSDHGSAVTTSDVNDHEADTTDESNLSGVVVFPGTARRTGKGNLAARWFQAGGWRWFGCVLERQ